MTLPLDGYRMLRLLRASDSTRVFAAVRERDQRRVVAKIYELADNEALEARVEHEFRLIHELEVEGVVRALALERAGTQLAVVLDWCEGVNLEEHAAGRPLPLDEFLAIALQLARVLADVHAQRVVHRDIKPTNILIDPETGVVRLADFGISVLLESERERIHDPAVVEGTLPYLSPEQTGRTGHEVDFRSDLYSLGVSFYELLTGRRPFEGSSPLELIHAHLARRPQPPQWLRPDLPTPLSAMIMKLLEKAPERRYQSARGLRLDLERLAAALEQGRKIDEFELGLGDVSMTLQLPHRLYGREVDVELLVREFRRASTGDPRCALVSGAAGIGKSALIGQLAEPVIGRHGYLARGKFVRELADKPYAGFVAVFTDLAEQLLTETDEQLGHWRREILQALGPVAGVLCELVPKLRAILGPTPPAREAGAIEAQNQLALACARLISTFARVEHPLVVALDDVHWADRSSCELLAAMLAEPRAALLVVATMRLDELPGAHPIREVIDTLERERDQTLWLDLGPLGRSQVASMVADSLALPPAEIQPLAELIGRKTNNNPLFIRQFLAHLVELGLLRATAEGWVWDQAAIEQAGIPDDLLAMMAEKLERLDLSSRRVLTAAAVIGTRFDLETLELLVGAERLAPALVRLVDEGLLTAVGRGRHAFTHDRIRDIAYAMTSVEQRVAMHREIGRFRLARASIGDLSEQVFELVDHVDIGLGLIAVDGEAPGAVEARRVAALAELDERERVHLAELNALAGYKSLNGAAAEAAVRYLGAGIELLASEAEFPRPGEPKHTLRLALELGLCQALALADRSEEAQRRYQALLRRPVEPSDYGRIVAKQIESLTLANRQDEAVEAGLAGLRSLGVTLSAERHGLLEVGSALLRLLPLLRRSELRGLKTRPRASDPRAQAAMDVLEALHAVSALTDPSLAVAVQISHLRLVLEHGRHPTGPMVLNLTAFMLAAVLGRRELALELVELASALANQEGSGCLRHRLEPIRWFVSCWRSPYAEAVDPLRKAGTQALEAGDIEYAGYTTAMLPGLSLAAGVHLRVLEQTCELAAQQLQQWRSAAMVPIATRHLAFARLLQSGDLDAIAREDPLDLRGVPDGSGLQTSKAVVSLLQAQLLLIFGRLDEAWSLVRCAADGPRITLSGPWLVEALLTTEGVLAAALHPRRGSLERVKLLAILDRNRRKLHRYAELGGPGLAAAAALLDAELAAIRRPIAEALALFGIARRKAAACRSPLLETLALERMAQHARDHGLHDLALGPISEARARYHYWGAHTKVAALEQRWPALRQDRSRPGERGDTTRTGSATGPGTSSSTSGRALDLATILKISQAIAEDLRLDEVVERVMTIGLENAGAERAALILRHEGKAGVVAICSIERSVRNYLRAPIPLDEAGDEVPISLIHFVERTLEPAVLDDLSADLRFVSDPYVERFRARSVLCLPIIKQSRLLGVLYLENKLSPASMTGERLELLRLLVAQAANALENAQLYEALRASEVRWRSLVEGLPDVVLLLDRRGRIEFINHVAADVDRARMIGTLAGEFIETEHIVDIRESMAEVIATGEQREFELRASFSGRGPRWYMARFAPIVVDGRVERIIAVGTDVTERREAEAAQTRLEATIRQQQRLESIGTLASGVAHEINNPVQGIMNYAELIATSPHAGEQAREFAAEIGHESQRVASIVRNLLAFSRQEGDRAPAPARVAEIVEGTLSLIRTVLRKDQIALHLDIPDELPQVRCRVQQIQQVIMNLVTNARDALRARWPDYHEDKRIEIAATSFERDARSWVRITVCDQGGGVPEEVVGRIFDPFFTTKGRDQGTGLGLAVSHGIVAEHGGELRLDNRPGESACFRVELPADGAPAKSR
ncbi:MAG: AAA family ATPase [Enhygromyxa sp.]